MPPALTELERKILDYMAGYLRTNTYQPSIREIGGRFGIKSTKTVSEHLQSLADKGYLERDPSRSRGVRILGMDLNAETVSVPCYRESIPERDALRSEAVEMYLSVDRRIAGSAGAFFTRVRGDDLQGLGISDGDMLLVEPGLPAEGCDGQVIVVREGDRVRYFRAFRRGSGLVLRSPSPAEAPREVPDPESLDVVGRVTALYRRMDGVPVAVSPITH